VTARKGKASAPRAAAKRPARDGVERKRVVRITVDQYNALFRAYQEKPSILHAAKAAGVSARAATRYIEGPGAPEEGLEPIAARVARINRAVQEHQDLTLREFKRGEVRVWLEALKTSEVELALHRIRLANQLKDAQAGTAVEPEQPLLAAIRGRDTAARMVERLLDAPDVTVASRRLGPDPLDDMTEEELLAYGRTGVLPERHRR
jgi:hypothetical protein